MPRRAIQHVPVFVDQGTVIATRVGEAWRLVAAAQGQLLEPSQGEWKRCEPRGEELQLHISDCKSTGWNRIMEQTMWNHVGLWWLVKDFVDFMLSLLFHQGSWNEQQATGYRRNWYPSDTVPGRVLWRLRELAAFRSVYFFWLGL